jgi:hypothetical protein
MVVDHIQFSPPCSADSRASEYNESPVCSSAVLLLSPEMFHTAMKWYAYSGIHNQYDFISQVKIFVYLNSHHFDRFSGG